jgi:hypothetical protein
MFRLAIRTILEQSRLQPFDSECNGIESLADAKELPFLMVILNKIGEKVELNRSGSARR